MDLQTRKYNFMEQIFAIDKESVLDALEKTLKRKKEEVQEISTATKKTLDQRLDSYKNNPDDILNWEDVKNDW